MKTSYETLKYIQDKIGGGCSVEARVGAFDGVLEIVMAWPNNLYIRRAISFMELEYVRDVQFLVDRIIHAAISEYELAAVGED